MAGLDPPRLVAVMGPTGAGKSWFAERLADSLGAVLVNADAFQVYRGFDVGTNKPKERARYRLLDIRDPREGFGVGEWVALARDVLLEVWQAGRSAVVVGGTGLYVRALFEGYGDLQPAPDPALRAWLARREAQDGLPALAAELRALDPHHRVDERNGVRVRRALERRLRPGPTVDTELPPFVRVKVGLAPDVRELDDALRSRVERMRADGWVEEVRRLREENVPLGCPAMRAIGYQSVVRYLEGVVSWDEAAREVWLATRRYAKRQRAWLRSEPNLVSLAVRPYGTEALAEALAVAKCRIGVERGH